MDFWSVPGRKAAGPCCGAGGPREGNAWRSDSGRGMPRKVMQYTYPGERRLKKRADFLACYQNGKRYFSKHFILFVSLQGGKTHGLRGGTAVSKKIGKAVTRNRVKRVLKEFFRLNQHRLDLNVDIVVVPKKHLQAAKISYNQVDRELSPVFSRIYKELKSQSPS